ncbi:alpha/beta fold hydrolase [Streptomyces sp. NPDC087212]|uniref:alpha/beta fold hydrolase n=1 Tax=Streptomyces sp. NPDC087212 TaxID=3365766 RepID=UPI003808B8DB
MTRQTLAVEYAGSSAPAAETAVFLHGLGGWTHNWAALIDLMRTSTHCLAIDLPGFGRSEPPPDGRLTVEGLAAAVVAHLERTGHHRVHLVGNSLGSLVALRIAAQHPDLVSTLTLIAPVLPARPSAQALRVALLGLPGAARLYARHLASRDPDRQLDDLYRLIYANPALAGPEQRAVEARERQRRSELPYVSQMLAEGVRALLRTYLHRGPESPWHQARRVTAPTLLVYGRSDRLAPLRTAAHTYAAFPNPRLLTLPTTAHVPMQETPTPVAQSLKTLIKEATTTQPT